MFKDATGDLNNDQQLKAMGKDFVQFTGPNDDNALAQINVEDWSNLEFLFYFFGLN